MKKSITSLMAVMSVVVAVSLVFTTTTYAQEDKTMMDKTHKYFVVQDTKTSVPDNLANGHEQYHQIAVALPPRDDGKVYLGQVSYSSSRPVSVLVQQPLNATVTQNATSIPLSNMEGDMTVSFTHDLEGVIADNVDFAGSSVYFHSRSNEPFTIAYTVAGKVVDNTPLP